MSFKTKSRNFSMLREGELLAMKSEARYRDGINTETMSRLAWLLGRPEITSLIVW